MKLGPILKPLRSTQRDGSLDQEGYDRMSAPVGGGMLTLRPEESVQARFDSMNQRLQQLELSPAKAIEEKCAM